MQREKLLAQDWSAGRLATVHSIKKFVFCNYGVSFKIVNEEYIEELKDKSVNENMNNNTEW